MNCFAIYTQLLLYFLYEMTMTESGESMPAPFTRVLYITTPLLSGKKKLFYSFFTYLISWLVTFLKVAVKEA